MIFGWNMKFIYLIVADLLYKKILAKYKDLFKEAG